MIKITPHRGFWRIFATFLAVSTALPLQASPAMEKLFYILKQKGSITADEYELLIATMKKEEAEKGGTSRPVAAPPALEQRLAADEAKLKNLESTIVSTKGQIEELSRITDNTSPSTMSKSDLDAHLSDKWYERIKMRGYIQTRFYGILGDGDRPGYHQPNDSGIANVTASIGIRRGRIVFSGDVTDHLYLYLQTDMQAGVGTSTALQARDVYGDISLDPAREFRFRIGLTKVPYAFSNLQSSQNRYALERPDALNSGVEGERDLGAYFIWAPYEIRNRFKDLVKMGLRGSGDYGVFNFGVYNGQGINNRDLNGDVHYIARLAYPFEFPNGQFLEVGASYYSGRYVPTTSTMGAFAAPTVVGGGGVRDRRMAINAILYPQPFGLEAEWTWGEGPQLSDDLRSISAQSLNGGFVQAVYRHVFSNQAQLLPFVRWNYFDGARKFATNAPKTNVNEIAVGFEYIPYPELEISLMYARGSRTNTTDNPAGAGARYRDVDYSYLGLQAQINF